MREHGVPELLKKDVGVQNCGHRDTPEPGGEVKIGGRALGTREVRRPEPGSQIRATLDDPSARYE